MILRLCLFKTKTTVIQTCFEKFNNDNKKPFENILKFKTFLVATVLFTLFDKLKLNCRKLL